MIIAEWFNYIDNQVVGIPGDGIDLLEPVMVIITRAHFVETGHEFAPEIPLILDNPIGPKNDQGRTRFSAIDILIKFAKLILPRKVIEIPSPFIEVVVTGF
jgi:hypothetical protein